MEGTRRTYNKVGDWIEKNIGKDVKILDASSGLGYGTADLKKRGFNIEDVEPYQSEERKKNNPATYSSYDDIPKDYDVIISNAVLNVIPDNWRSDVLHNMADHLKPGGIMFINTRKAGEERSIKDKIELDSPQEVLVKRNGKIASYQRFFAPKELKEWVEKELGNGYEVETANDNNSGTKGLAAVVVKKSDADIDRSVREFSPMELSNEDKQRRGDALRKAEPIDVKIKQIVKTKDMSARKAAEKWWKDNVGTSRFYDTEIGLVEINRASVGSSLAHRYSQAKLDAITSLVDGFNNAVYLGSMQDFSRQEGVKSHYFAYPINYNGYRNYVFCRAMQDANKNRLYVHEVFLADNIEKGNTLQTAAFQPHGGITLYKDILANVLTANIGNNSEPSKPRFSRKPGENIFDYASRVSGPVELYRDGELERVNEEFNNRLSSLAANRNQKDRVLKLGRPSRFLIDGGVTDAEIILEFDKLARKSDEGYKNEHPFDVMDVENLPLAIAYPIAVFDNTNGYSSGKVILTELEKDGRNFIVVVQTISQRRKGGVVLEVNRIDTLFPKEERGIVNWFNKGLASNIDKEKALRFIKALPNHPGTITKEELLSATKEVKNFENSKSSDVGRLVGALKDKTDFELYNRLAGEVEARNTEKRIGMTEEERRASLASETEDVAREDQILLRQGLDGIDIMRSEAAATPLKGDEALTALDSIFGENEGSAIPPKISSFAKFKNLFKKPVRTFLGELVQVKDEVWNKILRNNRQDITGTVLPTIENADFAIRDTDGSTLYVKRFKGDGQERMYNVVVVNKHGEVEDYISSVHIKRDNNLRNKIKKGAELFLPNARTTDGTMSRNNSTPGAKVANYSETAKPRFSRKPGESIFDYASRVSEDVDRSVRERVSARDEYEKKVKSKGFQTKEALQNSMLGLQEFMSAIDHASGNKRYIEDIPDFENPILGENRLSSVNKEESHSRLDAVHSPTPTKGVRKPYLRSYTMIYMPFLECMVLWRSGYSIWGLSFKQMKQNFSSEIFLWRECQRHQNPNLGDTDCESSADGDAEGIETTMELLSTGY